MADEPRQRRETFERAIALHQRGRLAEAGAAYEALLADRPDHAGALHYLGTVALQTGAPERAVGLIRRSLERTPDDAEAWDHLGLALREIGRDEEAAASLRRALDLRPDAPAAWSNLAAVLLDLGAPEEAAAAARRALDLSPELPGAHCNLGHALRELGRLGEAEACWRRALSLDANHVSALAGLAELTPRGENDPTVGRLEAIASGAATGRRERELVHFTLARVWDEAGQPAQAFGHASRGNALRAERLGPFDADRLADRYARLAELTPARLKAWAKAGSRSERPILIVGMPRSGTTLVERLLAGHPEVLPGGELPHLYRLGEEVEAAGGPHRFAFEPAWVRAASERYLGALPRRASTRATDKLPHNFELLWLASILLPRARVIHCRRDAVDTCLSCWLRDFAQPHAYKHDLGTLGRAWVLYRRVMDHWEHVLPLPILHVDYERLVEAPEPATRRIVEFCGLDWDDSCLELADQGPHLRTMTARQRVARRVHTGDVGRSVPYRPYLDELLQALASPATW